MTGYFKIKINGVEWTGEETEAEKNPYAMELISGEFYEGNTVTVKLADGKEYTRKVRDERKGDLHITIKNTKYYRSDITR